MKFRTRRPGNQEHLSGEGQLRRNPDYVGVCRSADAAGGHRRANGRTSPDWRKPLFASRRVLCRPGWRRQDGHDDGRQREINGQTRQIPRSAYREMAPEAAYTVSVVKDGHQFHTYQMTGKTPMAEFTDTPAVLRRSYYRVEVTGPQTPYPQIPESMALSGEMVGLSNPICSNFNPNF
jgi:hypothetical protein